MIGPVNVYPNDPPSGRGLLPVVLAVLVAVVVLGGAVTMLAVTGGDDDDSAEEPVAGQESPPAPDLGEVRVVEEQTTRHVGGEVDYDQAPPLGGDHDPAWLECGVYDEPVREENAVHSLEHGTVWVTYQPGLDEADVAALAGALPDESIVSPYDELAAPVVVSVWGAQLDLTGPDDPRLALFVAEYGDGHTSPEPFASCAGGVQRIDGESRIDARPPDRGYCSDVLVRRAERSLGAARSPGVDHGREQDFVQHFGHAVDPATIIGMDSQTRSYRTGGDEAVLDLTRDCAEFVAGRGDGLLHVFVPHATAGLAILETGAGSDDDLLGALAELLPADDRWRHRHGSPGHGRSHVLPALVPPYASVPVDDGTLALGTWQSICLVDLNVDNAERQVRLSFLPG